MLCALLEKDQLHKDDHLGDKRQHANEQHGIATVCSMVNGDDRVNHIHHAPTSIVPRLKIRRFQRPLTFRTPLIVLGGHLLHGGRLWNDHFKPFRTTNRLPRA